MAEHLTPEQLHEDQGPSLAVFFGVFSALPLIAVTLRLAARRLARIELWWDDWLLVVACVVELLQLVFLIESIQNGEGKHVQTVTSEQLKWYLIWTYASEIYYGVVVTLVKCSLLCLYLRVFGVNKTFVRICYGLLVFVVAWGVGTALTTILQCIPVSAAWDVTVLRPNCINLRAWLIANNVPNILADVIIILLPMPSVWKLNLSLPRRIALTFIFLLAFATTIISCLRVNATANIDVLDPTWGYVGTAKFSTMEANIGIVTACLPVLAPVVRTCLGRPATGSSRDRTSYSSTSHGLSKASARRSGCDPNTLQMNEDLDRLAGPRIYAAAISSGDGAAEPEGGVKFGQIHVQQDVFWESDDRS